MYYRSNERYKIRYRFTYYEYRGIADSTIVRATVLSEQQELELEDQELLKFFFHSMSWMVEVAPETDDRLGHGERSKVRDTSK